MVRLPLQVGTTATWAAARVAIALFPALSLFVVGVLWVKAGVDGEAIAIPFVLGGLLLAYAWFYARLALRSRASDLRFLDDALAIDGGRHGRTRIPWAELTEPYARVEDAEESRLVLWRLPLTAIAVVGGEGVDPTAKRPAWRLAVWRQGARVQIGETDRAIEAQSMRAAVATIQDLCAGRKAMARAAAIETAHAPCPECGAPLVPDDDATVECAYCKRTVPLPETVRAQAAAALVLSRRQRRNARAIARLLRQPGAAISNLWLALFTIVMIGGWPLAWWLVGARVRHAGLHAADVGAFFLPVGAVIGGFFFARGRLASRGALQLLSLGFGALAPEHAGEPPLCRMCQGPLPPPGVGGVVRCRYCAADNIAGIDLRPLVDARRGEHKHFTAALARSRRERWRWLGMTVVALGVFAALAYATWRYLR
jgi:hypothetical protein